MKKLMTFGEALIRVSSGPGETFTESSNGNIKFGGSELNVALTSRSLGLESDWVSYLPESELGEILKDTIQKNGLALQTCPFIDHPMAVYFIEQGAEPRPTKVIDRIKGPLAHPERELFNWESILEGQNYFHTSGISTALSEKTREDVYNAISFASENNIITSYDFNYRGRLWPLEDAKKFQTPLLSKIDILFGGEKDLEFMLELNLSDDLTSYQSWQSIYNEVYNKFDFKNLVISQRKSEYSQDFYRVIAMDSTEFHISPWFNISNIDRIGAGDAMTAGFLSSHSQNKSLKDCVWQAAACGALKHSLQGDYYQITPSQINRWLKDQSTWR